MGRRGEVLKADLAALLTVWSCLSTALVTEIILWGEEVAQSNRPGEWTRVSPAERPRAGPGMGRH